MSGAAIFKSLLERLSSSVNWHGAGMSAREFLWDISFSYSWPSVAVHSDVCPPTDITHWSNSMVQGTWQCVNAIAKEFWWTLRIDKGLWGECKVLLYSLFFLASLVEVTARAVLTIYSICWVSTAGRSLVRDSATLGLVMLKWSCAEHTELSVCTWAIAASTEAKVRCAGEWGGGGV